MVKIWVGALLLVCTLLMGCTHSPQQIQHVQITRYHLATAGQEIVDFDQRYSVSSDVQSLYREILDISTTHDNAIRCPSGMIPGEFYRLVFHFSDGKEETAGADSGCLTVSWNEETHYTSTQWWTLLSHIIQQPACSRDFCKAS
jgi:hypothetical protein